MMIPDISLPCANNMQPYVVEHSRSIYARLGARIGFFGIDARTEVSYVQSLNIRKTNNYSELENKSTIQKPIRLSLTDYGKSLALRKNLIRPSST